jgi:hypothetical protein
MADKIIDHFYMKKIELLHFTVATKMTTARHCHLLERCRAVFCTSFSTPITPQKTATDRNPGSQQKMQKLKKKFFKNLRPAIRAPKRGSIKARAQTGETGAWLLHATCEICFTIFLKIILCSWCYCEVLSCKIYFHSLSDKREKTNTKN